MIDSKGIYSTFLCCKLHVVRRGSEYGSNRNTFTSTGDWCFPSAKIPSLTVGGDENNFIQVKNLLPRHLECGVLDDAILFQASGAIKIIVGTREHQLKAGQKISIPITPSMSSFQWKMIFPDNTLIAGKICGEQEQLPEGIQAYLQTQYGSIEKIQEGKSSLMFRTTDNRVLKILRPSFAENKGALRRFLSAVRKFQVLPADLFLQIHEIIYRRELTLCYAVMENFPGESLQNRLTHKGTFPPDEAARIVRAIAKNLSVLQKYKYCSRNLNPENLLLREDGQVRLTGFFLLKSEDAHLTLQGAQMIIPKYTAPEQVLDPTTADILSDMFSLGAIFYSLCIGEPPFSTATKYSEFLQSDKDFRPEDIKDTMSDIPFEYCELISALLSREKNKRPTPEMLMNRLSDQGKNDSGGGEAGSLEENLFAGLDGLEEKEIEIAPKNAMEQSVTDKSLGFTQSYVALLDKVDQDATVTQEAKKDESENYSIEVIGGPAKKQHIVYNFTGERTVVIGREGDLRIPLDCKVSRKHAELEVSKEHCYLTDLESPNGVYINGKKITRQEITSGIEFIIGRSIVRFSKVNTPLGGVLEDSDHEFSEEDIAQLKELKITAFSRHSSLEKTNEVLKNMYQNLDKTEDNSANLKVTEAAMPIMKQKTSVLSHKKNVIHHGCEKKRMSFAIPFIAGAVVISLIFIVIHFMFPPSKSIEPSSKTIQGEPTMASQNPPTPVRNAEMYEGNVKSFRGKIERIAFYNNRIQYFVLSCGRKSTSKYAICLSKNFSQTCVQPLKDAKKTQTKIKILGIQKTLPRGMLLVGKKRTKKYYLAQKITIGSREFPNY